MSEPRQYACSIEVWGLEPKTLPETFGATKFLVRSPGELDDLASLVGATVSDHQRVTLAEEYRSAFSRRESPGTAALHCVCADDPQSALAQAEREIKLTIDCMNFFSDLGPTHLQSPLRVRLRGSPAHRELRVAVAENGDCFMIGEPGLPRNFSLRVLRQSTGGLRKSIDRVEELLRGSELTDVQKRLLRAVRWGGLATAEPSGGLQFLSFMIALECIVKPSRIRNIRETVAKRTAGLQALTDIERQAIKRDLEDLYVHRSAVVHTGSLVVSERDGESLTSQMRRRSKGAIITLLIDPVVSELTSFDELTTYLDRFDVP